MGQERGLLPPRMPKPRAQQLAKGAVSRADGGPARPSKVPVSAAPPPGRCWRSAPRTHTVRGPGPGPAVPPGLGSPLGARLPSPAASLVKDCHLLALRGKPVARPPPSAWAAGEDTLPWKRSWGWGEIIGIMEWFELEVTFNDKLSPTSKDGGLSKVLGWQSDLQLSRLHQPSGRAPCIPAHRQPSRASWHLACCYYFFIYLVLAVCQVSLGQLVQAVINSARSEKERSKS